MGDDKAAPVAAAGMALLFTTGPGMSLDLPPYGTATNTKPVEVPAAIADSYLSAKKMRGGKKITVHDPRLSRTQTIFPPPPPAPPAEEPVPTDQAREGEE
jgi:hypothetical protein